MTETFTATAKTLNGNKPWMGKVTAETPWHARNLATTMAARATGEAVHQVRLFRDKHTEVDSSEIWPPAGQGGASAPTRVSAERYTPAERAQLRDAGRRGWNA